MFRPFRGTSPDKWADYICKGGCHFYIAAVGPNGQSLDLTNEFFLPYGLPQSMIVGSELFDMIQSNCNLDDGCAMALDRHCVSAHVWPYELPTPDQDADLYGKIINEMNIKESPDFDELMRRLCSCRPAPFELPQMYIILAPILLRHTWVWRHRRQDRIILSLGKNAPGRAETRPAGLSAHRAATGIASDALIRTRRGDVPATPEFLQRNPIVAYDGFLVPPVIAGEFATSRTCSDQTVDCMLDVTFEW